jgi:hypothetical protein
MFLSLCLVLSGKARSRSAQRRRPAFRRPDSRLLLEELEDRTLPSVNPGYLVAATSSAIYRIDPTTGAESLLLDGSSSSISGGISWVAVEANGDIDVGVFSSVYRFDPSTGNITFLFGKRGTGPLAIDPKGDFVEGIDGAIFEPIYRIDPGTGDVSVLYPVGDNVTGANVFSIVVEPNGYIDFEGEALHPDRLAGLLRLDPSTGDVTTLVGSDQTPFTAVATDPQGDLVAAASVYDEADQQVLYYIDRIDPTTGAVTQLLESSSSLTEISSLAVEANGDIDFATDLGLFRFDPSTGDVTALASGEFVAVAVGASTPQVTPVSLNWNTTQGGLDYTYKVSDSDLTKDVPVGLYWASGPQWSNRIQPIPGYSFSIPSGTHAANAAYGPVHVDGTLLRNAPDNTTYLLVVTDPNNTLGNFDPAKNVVALHDVTIQGADNSVYPISALTLETIKGLLRESGQGDEPAVISSTVRTPHQQAVAMYRNLRAGKGRNYATPGQAVIAVYDALVAQGVTNQTTIVNAMEAEIIRQRPYNVSHHCADAAEWAQLQVIDIDPSSITNNTLFHNAATAALGDGRLSAFFDPQDDDPAFHLEIPQ